MNDSFAKDSVKVEECNFEFFKKLFDPRNDYNTLLKKRECLERFYDRGIHLISKKDNNQASVENEKDILSVIKNFTII